METTAVQLGRFAPYHKGHQMVSETMINKHGKDNCLIMIGSSTSFNPRTPFTFEQRRGMIQRALGQGVEIIGLPDTNPTLATPTEDSYALWRKNLKEIESARETQFKFYGGSQADLGCLAAEFETEVIVNRSEAGKGINATAIRQLLKEKQTQALKEILDERIVEDVIRFFHQNLLTFTL